MSFTVCVVSEIGYDEGDVEVVAAFTTQERADVFVMEQSARYIDPERFARQHFSITEVPLD